MSISAYEVSASFTLRTSTRSVPRSPKFSLGTSMMSPYQSSWRRTAYRGNLRHRYSGSVLYFSLTSLSKSSLNFSTVNHRSWKVRQILLKSCLMVILRTLQTVSRTVPYKRQPFFNAIPADFWTIKSWCSAPKISSTPPSNNRANSRSPLYQGLSRIFLCRLLVSNKLFFCRTALP